MAITRERIEEIEAVAQTVLSESFGDSFVLPVNLKVILAKEGLALKTVSFEDSEVIGAYNREKKEIYISDKESYQRTSFTIAHELGHYILHRHKAAETFFRADTFLQGKQDADEESDANCFAAALLMPKARVKSYHMWLGNNKDRLSKLFGVSNIAMNYRLKNMNLI